jgi:hypothetical protein
MPTNYDAGILYDASRDYDGLQSTIAKVYIDWTRQIVWSMALDQDKSILDNQRFTGAATEALVHRITKQWAEFQMERARQQDNMIFAALLSEI